MKTADFSIAHVIREDVNNVVAISLSRSILKQESYSQEQAAQNSQDGK